MKDNLKDSRHWTLHQGYLIISNVSLIFIIFCTVHWKIHCIIFGHWLLAPKTFCPLQDFDCDYERNPGSINVQNKIKIGNKQILGICIGNRLPVRFVVISQKLLSIYSDNVQK